MVCTLQQGFSNYAESYKMSIKELHREDAETTEKVQLSVLCGGVIKSEVNNSCHFYHEGLEEKAKNKWFFLHFLHG